MLEKISKWLLTHYFPRWLVVLIIGALYYPVTNGQDIFFASTFLTWLFFAVTSVLTIVINIWLFITHQMDAFNGHDLLVGAIVLTVCAIIAVILFGAIHAEQIVPPASKEKDE